MTELVAKWKWRRIPLSVYPGILEHNAENSRREEYASTRPKFFDRRSMARLRWLRGTLLLSELGTTNM